MIILTNIYTEYFSAESSKDKKYIHSQSTDYQDSEEGTVQYLSSDEENLSSSGKSTRTQRPSQSSSTSFPGSSSDSDSFSSSDEEPLSKYRKRKSSADEGHSTDTMRTPSQSVGRPRGRAKPPARDRNRHFCIVQKNVRHDGVDEECARLGIYYKKWRPLNPDQTSHVSIHDLEDATVIPHEQEIPQWCIMCPHNRFLKNEQLGLKHYLSLHHKTLLIVRDFKMWACKCSEVCSHGSDNSTRSMHYHCFDCFHPFKMGDLLSTHLVTAHEDIRLAEVRHLMSDSNPHKYSHDF